MAKILKPFYRLQKERNESFLKVLFNTGGMATTRLVGDLASFFLFILFSRRFGPAGIGQYAYGFAISGLLFSAVSSVSRENRLNPLGGCFAMIIYLWCD